MTAFASTPATARIPLDPLAIAAKAGLVALVLAFVLAVHDRGGTTYDGCAVPEDPATCTEVHHP